MSKERDPWIRIMVAAAHGKGLHLTADEVFALSLDDAIATCAINGLEDGEAFGGEWDWESIDPMRKRIPGNRFAKERNEL